MQKYVLGSCDMTAERPRIKKTFVLEKTLKVEPLRLWKYRTIEDLLQENSTGPLIDFSFLLMRIRKTS